MLGTVKGFAHSGCVKGPVTQCFASGCIELRTRVWGLRKSYPKPLTDNYISQLRLLMFRLVEFRV